MKTRRQNFIGLFVIFLLLVSAISSMAQDTGLLKGMATDVSGKPLRGITVKLINAEKEEKTNLTDEKGVFIFSKLAYGQKYDLVFSYVGYEQKHVRGFIVNREDNNSLTVKLEQSKASLEEVVVIGYGSQKKKDVSAAIGSLKMDGVDQGSSFNAVKNLQGRVSGVNVITPSGSPGTPPIVMIRGIGSISGGGAPLYVIDGIPNETFPNINPNDVEKIDILKDAASASIYGSRANNGVVVITTRSGKSGKTSIGISSRIGIGRVYNDIKMANSDQYAQTMKVAIDNYNKQMGTQISLYRPEEIEETDWVAAISRAKAITKSFDINLGGGTEKTKFFTSFGYYDQEGILQTSNYRQYNFRANITQQINHFVKLNMNLSGSAAPRRLVEENDMGLKVLRNAREEQPWYSPFLADGNYKVNGTYIFRHNPVMQINEEKWIRRDLEGLGTVNLEITPIKGLKFIPSISAYGFLTDESKKITEKNAARGQSAGWGALAQDRNLGLRYVWDNILSYDNHLEGINYSVMVGHSFESYSNDRLGAFSDNYKNGAYPSSGFNTINAGSNIYPSAKIGFDSYALESYLGRLSLDYKKRYLLNISARRDGSSKFTKDTRFGTFPAFAAAWNVSEESFWNSGSFFSDLKVRASYGRTGSMAGINNYAALALVKSGNSYNNQGGFSLSQDAQRLSWEKQRQIDIGFDAQFLDKRINFTADYFEQKTTNLLFNKPIFSTSGYTSIPANIGALKNNGVELSIDASLLNGPLNWKMGGNISFIKNKLLSLYDNASMYVLPASGYDQLGGQMHALINGKSIGSFYMLKQLGIYQYDVDVPEKLFAKGVRAGDVKYEDVNGDGDITTADRQYVGKATPDYFGGFTSNMKWKGIELNIFGQFSVGNKLMASWRGVNSEGTEHLGDSYSNVKINDGTTREQYYNISEKAATEYWTGPGTSNSMPRPVRRGVFSGYSTSYNQMPSTRFLEDAGFLKLKTVTLAYNLPNSIASKMGAKDIRCFFSVDNLVTFTKYSGYDPEQSYVTNPGDSNYGVDFGLQSALRTYMFGFNLKF